MFWRYFSLCWLACDNKDFFFSEEGGSLKLSSTRGSCCRCKHTLPLNSCKLNLTCQVFKINLGSLSLHPLWLAQSEKFMGQAVEKCLWICFQPCRQQGLGFENGSNECILAFIKVFSVYLLIHIRDTSILLNKDTFFYIPGMLQSSFKLHRYSF